MNLAPMIIDSFAGGGGASTGIERALGRSPDVAINHSAAALALHAATGSHQMPVAAWFAKYYGTGDGYGDGDGYGYGDGDGDGYGDGYGTGDGYGDGDGYGYGYGDGDGDGDGD